MSDAANHRRAQAPPHLRRRPDRLVLVVFWVALAALGPLARPLRRRRSNGVGLFAPMSAAHPFGTDYLGRDMLSRILHGARYTVGVAFLATLLACLGGLTLGLLARCAAAGSTR